MGAAERLSLSRDEIAEIARSPRKKAQIAFLVANGIRHYLDAHGWPVVLRSAVDGDAKAGGADGKTWRSNKAA